MKILGINAHHGDASAAIVVDGKLIAAAEEERFNRIKHCAGFPQLAIEFCLERAALKIDEIDHIAISRDPKAHLLQKVIFGLSRAHQLSSMIKDRLNNALKVKDLRQQLADALSVNGAEIKAKLHYVEHHRAHLASAFFVSPFERALILSVDGMGDFVSTMYGRGEKNKIEVFDQVLYPHSLGMLYTATTQYLGFTKYGDEGKVMGLAPYGQPTFLKTFEKMVKIEKDGKFELNLDYFLHHKEGVQMTWDEGSPTLGKLYSDLFIKELGPVRDSGQAVEEKHQDIAASLQAMLEKALFAIIENLRKRCDHKHLCLAGGVALNSVFNGKIWQATDLEDIYIQAGAGDGGTAIGAAYDVQTQILDQPRNFVMTHPYTGPSFSKQQIAEELNKKNISGQHFQSVAKLAKQTAKYMAQGKIVGWFQGAMEFGPRALGNRSIVVDPRRSEMKDILNSRIKHREPFRPFAPSILEERLDDYFEIDKPSPFMLMVYQVKEEKRQEIPAVTHVDNSGRLQTVSKESNPRYHQLISAFAEETGVPVILNTSFNENEPIVCTPTEAINCFLKTKMDILVLENTIIKREE